LFGLRLGFEAQVFISTVAELNKAKSEILVQAYSVTSKPIAKALVDAHKRGVHTEIILDKSPGCASGHNPKKGLLIAISSGWEL
jgi:phosphatidylserine/phosphatidylglycerophosphate/cardiolipin synthase-like enzyme